MAQIHRKVFEGLRYRMYPTTGTGVIEVGDLVEDDGSGNARAVSTRTDATGGSAAARQQLVRDGICNNFLGVAMSGKATGETPDVRVCIDGVFEYEVPAALGSAAVQGTLVEAHATDNGTTATGVDQQLNVASGSLNSIGRLAKAAANAATIVTAHLVGRDAYTRDTARIFTTTAAVDPANAADEARVQVNVTIAGVEVGDIVLAQPPSTLEAGLAFMGATVTAQDTVQVSIAGLAAAGVDGASLTWVFVVIKR